MATESAPAEVVSDGRALTRSLLLAAAATVGVAVVGLAIAALTLSGATLGSDPSALARISLQPLGGGIGHVEAFAPDGRRVPLKIDGERLTPATLLAPGERISIDVQVQRPGWIGWALGDEHTEHLTLRAPAAHLSERWLTVAHGSAVRVSFEQPVSTVRYGDGSSLPHELAADGARTVSLGHRPATGTLAVAAAARPWEKVGAPTHVSWFPPSRTPVMAVSPSAGSPIAPSGAIYLTFSKPLSEVLGSSRPRLTPSVAGRWLTANSHTLEFRPAGFGAPLGTQLHVQLPHSVAVTSGGGRLRSTSQLAWSVPAGSTLRLHQLLAQAGYLPVAWKATGAPVARTPAAEARAAVQPPGGSFHWRYGHTPHQLEAIWSPDRASVVTKGALMKFESLNGLTADGVAGATVWRKLLAYAVAGKHLNEGYSYVYVRREVPETMTLWHAGRTILVSPANTGISGAETALGTYPVFEHMPEGTMSGTNPDGSHYEDPGIKWISYFNGGDALHNFDRSSFGTPQSLGCVELPLAASARIYPYTPIGTLVTVEP
jgi:hypothetical protein